MKVDLAHAYAISGQQSEARKMLDEFKEDLSRGNHVSPYDVAILHLDLGETDQALEWLEKSYAERERAIVRLKVIPDVDPLRSDPRFAELIQHVGLWQK